MCYSILHTLGVLDDSQKAVMLEVIKGSISSDISGLSQSEFMDLVKDALDCVCIKQQEQMKKAQEEHELKASKYGRCHLSKTTGSYIKKTKRG